MDSQTLYKAGSQTLQIEHVCACACVCTCTNARAQAYVFEFIPCWRRPCGNNGVGCVDGGADVVVLVVVMGWCWW